ncbi:serine hydrolase [Flavobacterium sp. RHBU_24]|uniref:serine hydrolase n=1 Tax=Flavobacterium sp. RHBU_24 TaxID=3391185 RepID=UPI0039853976
MKASIIAILFLFVTTLSSIKAQTPLQNRIKKVENGLIPYVPVKGLPGWTIAQRMGTHKIPGMSIAVIDNYKIDFAKSYGYADTIQKVPATNNTIYSAGSVSKMVTAIIVMRLVDKGLLDLDTDVNQYLTTWKIEPSSYTVGKGTTLRMLLSHTAGTSQSSYWGFKQGQAPLPSIKQILDGDPIAGTRRVVVNSEPGKEFRYSGGGYMIVQMVLMDVLKADFETIARKYVFNPLKMDSSTFDQPLPKKYLTRLSTGYSEAPWYTPGTYVYPQQAAAGLHTNATDLALLIIEMEKSLAGTSSFLKTETVRQMLTPQIEISNGQYTEEMGLGAFLYRRSDATGDNVSYFEHVGVNAGFVGFATGSLAGGHGVLILLNSGDDFNGFGKELIRSIAAAYQWPAFLPDTLLPAKLTEKELEEFCGRYRKGPNEVVEIMRRDGHFAERINGGKEILCFPTGNDSIVFSDYNIKGLFLRDSSGRISALRTEYQIDDQAWPFMSEGQYTAREYITAGKYVEAERAILTDKLSENELTYWSYELINSKKPDVEGIGAILKSALALYPESPIVHLRMGDLALLNGNKAEARAHYEKACALDPEAQDCNVKLKATE